MDTQEYDDIMRTLTRIATRQETMINDLHALRRVGDQVQHHEDILRSLTAMLVAQQEMNQQQARLNEQQVATNARLTTAIERLEGILVAIRELLQRGNGR